MRDIRLNGVVLHAVEQVLLGILSPSPAHVIKSVIKLTQMDLLHFDLWTTKKMCKYSHMEGVTQCVHMAAVFFCFFFPTSHQNSNPAEQRSSLALWCFSQAYMRGLLNMPPSFPYWTGMHTHCLQCPVEFGSSSHNTGAPHLSWQIIHRKCVFILCRGHFMLLAVGSRYFSRHLVSSYDVKYTADLEILERCPQ